MESIVEKMRKDLIKAGLLKPDEQIDNTEIAARWQEYQIQKVQSTLTGTFAGMTAEEIFEPPTEVFESSDKEELKDVDIRGGIKKALNSLLTLAKGASYCMIVVDRAWINFRYKRSKNNLHIQVAGNQYITPLKLSDDDIKHLEEMGIPPEPMSVEIYARDYDDEPRDLDTIVNEAISIFNEIYHVSDGDDAYVELDLGKGESEEILDEVGQFFTRRSGKKMKWTWDRSV
ncbi:MAG: hypothetical protein RTU30_04440 [Candidatus Thorarchaeota archaeon]